ncbi:helix-turn-helix transcriptional regulator [Tropicimonas sp. S265A]|uniref:helix-turn-helix transcriptional regulator n=1 Tax=Tropicimonas sp. S265A TaxID=3415134 RepID=UPI003C7DCE77
MTASVQDIMPGLHIRQYRQARFDRIVSPFPGVIRVELGEKKVGAGADTLSVGAGSYVILPEHTEMTVENLPEPGMGYAATALAFSRAVFEAAYSRFDPMLLGRAETVQSCAAGPEVAAAFEAAMLGLANGAPKPRTDLLSERLALELALVGACLPHPRPTRFADTLRECLAADISRSWTAERAAATLGISSSTIRRRLRAEGTAFSFVLRELRLASGLHLLQTTRWPIASVAHAVGYTSPSRFSQRFRARFGMAPGDVRKPPSG